MRLLQSIGPNPRLVRMFLIEKGIELPAVDVDIIAGENRQAPFLAINPSGSTPVLMLDSGEALAETTAICEYLEELHPQPPLIGSSTRMWTRRIDLAIVQPMTNGFRAAEGLPMFRDRVHCLPRAADDLKATAREGLAWLEAQLGERVFIAGEAPTLADLMLYSFVEFGALVGQGLDGAHVRLAAWHRRMDVRDSARATA
jgi:glutathione S-transferase